MTKSWRAIPRSFLLQLHFLAVSLVNLGLLCFPTSYLRVFWLRIFFSSVNRNISLQRGVKITSLVGEIKIGAHSIVGVGTVLDNRRGVLIGENVNISRECIVLSLGHDVTDPEFPTMGGPVKILDHAWLFMGVKVMPGCTIGENSVIYSFSVVTKSTPKFSVSAGVPAILLNKKVACRSIQKPYRYLMAF